MQTPKAQVKQLLGVDTKRFNLLSIGQRGVGKTVFLAGSYAELHADTQTRFDRTLRFDCQDAQEQKNIEQILTYVAETGQYPPPTMKVTEFNFSLKRRGLWGDQTLCHFRWWEIPGEICQMSNQEFHKIVSSSHGCCVFIDAYELMRNNTYLLGLEDILETVMGLASLVYLNDFKYAFALILTKCDQLARNSFDRHQLEEQLQPLTSYLDGMKINYRLFYSHIPVVQVQGAATLSAKGAAEALLWLVWELGKAHKPVWFNNLLDLLTHLRATDSQLQQELQVLDNGSLETLFKPWNSHGKKVLAIKKTLTARRNRLLLTLAITSVLGGSGILLFNFKQFQHQSKDIVASRELTTLEQRGLFYQAVASMEKLVQEEPHDLELRLQLAQLYQTTGQAAKAEMTYDWILVRQKNNLNALIGKATMREVQGDSKTARTLFAQAENVAPTNLKAKVRTVAEKILQSPTEQSFTSEAKGAGRKGKGKE